LLGSRVEDLEICSLEWGSHWCKQGFAPSSPGQSAKEADLYEEEDGVQGREAGIPVEELYLHAVQE
jgi:hypothetical protein